MIGRPRERMASSGPDQLTDAELIALILGQPSTGSSSQLLTRLGGLCGIAQATDDELRTAAHGTCAP